MANLTGTDFNNADGVRAVKQSEQGVITGSGSDVFARLTILGRITATGKYYPYNVGDSPTGTVTPVAVLLSAVTTTEAADYPCSIMLAGEVEESKLIIDGSAAGVGITDAIKDSLRTYGIFVVPTTECSIVDNA